MDEQREWTVKSAVQYLLEYIGRTTAPAKEPPAAHLVLEKLQADLNMQCRERDAVSQERSELELERDALKRDLDQLKGADAKAHRMEVERFKRYLVAAQEREAQFRRLSDSLADDLGRVTQEASALRVALEGLIAFCRTWHPTYYTSIHQEAARAEAALRKVSK